MIEGLEAKLAYPDWVYHRSRPGQAADRNKAATGKKTNKGTHNNVHKKTQ